MLEKFVFIAMLCIGMIAMKESTSMWEDLSIQSRIEPFPIEITTDSCDTLMIQEIYPKDSTSIF